MQKHALKRHANSLGQTQWVCTNCNKINTDKIFNRRLKCIKCKSPRYKRNNKAGIFT